MFITFIHAVFQLSGGVILGVALWLRHDNQTSQLLMLQFDNAQAPTTFYISVYILIAVGALMMLVGFLGCYGAIQESQCLLGTVSPCTTTLPISFCESSAGTSRLSMMRQQSSKQRGMSRKAEISCDSISKELTNFYDAAYDKYTSEPKSKDVAGNFLKIFHRTVNCCGKDDYKDVKDLCPGPKTVNCHTVVKDLFSTKVYLIGISALVVTIIMVFEMIFSMTLCCAIHNSPY
ncbi:hypothetical protein JZ751_002690 [Albula glossodonta]|uniref:Tetraspanin n=1 Tax=Albula glossodonta TaxID=121402 RepID=A0A8T2N7N3_9TELE|nr:hypothetical protein JZ751_002690 [Albula glossodonta]